MWRLLAERGRLLAVQQADQDPGDEGVACAERVDDQARDLRRRGAVQPAVGQQGGAGRAAGGQDEARTGVGRGAQQPFGRGIVQVARGEGGDVDVRQERRAVLVRPGREVEGHGTQGCQTGELVLEQAAVAGVDQVEARQVGQVVVVERELGDAEVVSDERPLPVAQLDHGVGGRPGQHAQAVDLDRLRAQRVDDRAAGGVVADRTHEGAGGAGPGGGHGDVQGVPAGIHRAPLRVAVDQAVAGADDAAQYATLVM